MVQLGRVIRDEESRAVHTLAAEYVHGYDADRAIASENALTGKLERLFENIGAPPACEKIVAVEHGSIIGAAILEPSWAEDLPIEDRGDLIDLTRFHYLLAGLFVQTQYRGKEIGRRLLSTACEEALSRGARYVEGFVNDRSGSSGFYRRFGAVMMPHNEGLPGRSPTYVRRAHTPWDNGYWFYIDLWSKFAILVNCPKCGQKESLAFDPSLGGFLLCAKCGSRLGYNPPM